MVTGFKLKCTLVYLALKFESKEIVKNGQYLWDGLSFSMYMYPISPIVSLVLRLGVVLYEVREADGFSSWLSSIPSDLSKKSG